MDVRAAVTDGDGVFAIETVGIDAPQQGEVLVGIKASGVCHTDWDSLRWGKLPDTWTRGAGEVLAIGAGGCALRNRSDYGPCCDEGLRFGG